MSLFGKSFGAPATTSSAPASNLFGSTATTQGQSGSLFGATTAASQPQQSGSLFGGSFAPKPASTGLFGQPAQSQQQQQQQQSGGLFGASTNNQQQQQKSGGLFGSLGQSTIQPQNQSQQQHVGQPQQSTSLSQSVSRIWSEQEQPRQKSVAEQIALIYQKWNPASPNSQFHSYLYNQVEPSAAPFYRPDASENEEKWEEALRAAPNPGAIPFLVRGFEQLGHRIIHQEKHLRLLQGRMHEINNGLSVLLRKHDLEISTRAAECRRRHTRLSQKCLELATKTQILRNRGYALEGAEEELALKLKRLERAVCDPALEGRGEEIWARMVNVRERGRWLQEEFEKAGETVKDAKEGKIDEEVIKQASKILEDYDKQLVHLSKEMEHIKTDFEEWEQAKPGGTKGIKRSAQK